MLEIAYASKNNDPYIIDSIGWAYYLIGDHRYNEQKISLEFDIFHYDFGLDSLPTY